MRIPATLLARSPIMGYKWDMRIREVIVALEAFAQKHGDDFETGVGAMWMCNPPTAIVIGPDGNTILVNSDHEIGKL